VIVVATTAVLVIQELVLEILVTFTSSFTVLVGLLSSISTVKRLKILLLESLIYLCFVLANNNF
jgi:hypothetical protein